MENNLQTSGLGLVQVTKFPVVSFTSDRGPRRRLSCPSGLSACSSIAPHTAPGLCDLELKQGSLPVSPELPGSDGDGDSCSTCILRVQ